MDPLTRQESFTYDLTGNLRTWTDRKGQVTSYQYDALDRLTIVGFGTTGNPPTYASTITTTYDDGNRVTQVLDSVAGTIERTCDLLDPLTQEDTPEGTIDYVYDAAGRRTSMTVAGQTAVSYTYDNADRLTAVTQGTATVSIGYDAASRRTTLTLPNGILVEYTYDDDSQLAGLTYKLSGATIGTLTYASDMNGQRVAVDGTGLLFYRARYYDPRLQRFIAEDPIGFDAGDVNLHGYVGNAPADLVDPTGEFAGIAPLAACIGGAIGRSLGLRLAGRKVNLRDLLDGCVLGLLPFGMPGAGAWLPFLPLLRPAIPALPKVAPLLPRIASRLPGPLRRLLPPVRNGGGGRPQFRDPFGAETFAGPDAPFWSEGFQGARGLC